MNLIESALLVAGIAVGIGIPIVRVMRSRASLAQGEKSEALFRTMFPDLQPHFHPANVLAYVRARLGREGSGTWDDPPGFPGAARAVLERTPKGERTLLQDSAGAILGEFLFDWGDKPPTIGMVRVGKGKFRVKHPPNKPQWVSYWHPDREFDWRGPGLWTFRSRIADEPIDASDRGTSWSSDSNSSTATAAAATAGLVAAGGTFDGGGASAGWDGAGGAAHEPASGELGSLAASADAGSSSGDSGSGSYSGESGSEPSSGDSSSDSTSTSY